MLNIVIITLGFAVNENDLVSVPFLQLYLKDLLKHNVKLTIIATQFPASKNYQWHGIEVITLVKKESKLRSKLLYKYRLHKTLQALNKKNKIDVIHHIWFNDDVYSTQKFSLKHHIKHIVTFAGQDALKENKALKNIYNYHGKLVCVSKFQQLKLEETTSVKTNIIHWGIENIKPDESSKSIDIISCGWINDIKNHSLLIDIIYECCKIKEIQKVVICGDGPELKHLIKKIQLLKLEHVIEIKGSIPRDEVIELMKKSKILVHTSHFEGFGLVLAEGLACGCKVISTPVGIAYDDISIITSNNKHEFVQEINKQLPTPKKVNIHNHYPLADTVTNYLSLYKK